MQDFGIGSLATLNYSAVCSLTGLQRLQVNLACSEWFGEQPPFVECPHDAIDFSLDFYRVISLEAIPKLERDHPRIKFNVHTNFYLNDNIINHK